MPGKKPAKVTKQQLADLLNGVYADKYTTHKLPKFLYEATAEHLKEGLYKGFGGKLKDFAIETADRILLEELRENIYRFSGAKTLQNVKDLVAAVTDDNGTKRSFADFKADALEINDQYNVNWLRAEFDTAFASGQMGALWNDIEENKELFPFLRISVVEDENTSDICEPLDGITLPVDDEFWDDYYPPNHFNCRSTVEQLETADAKPSDTDSVDRATEHADQHMSDEFKMNVGKDGLVFSDEHPYFEMDKHEKESVEKLEIPKNDGQEYVPKNKIIEVKAEPVQPIINVPAPIVNIPAPIVTVEAPIVNVDISPVIEANEAHARTTLNLVNDQTERLKEILNALPKPQQPIVNIDQSEIITSLKKILLGQEKIITELQAPKEWHHAITKDKIISKQVK